jgi:Threonine aldolase
MMGALATDHRGAMRTLDITAAIKPDDLHCPISRLLCLENTVSGHVHDVEHITALATVAKARGLLVHLDGARLMNAAVKLGVPVNNIVKVVDSVSLCLSKGLGTPAGSVLVGSAAFLVRARRLRQLVGGGLRLCGLSCRSWALCAGSSSCASCRRSRPCFRARCSVFLSSLGRSLKRSPVPYYPIHAASKSGQQRPYVNMSVREASF